MGNTFARMLNSTETDTWKTGGQQRTTQTRQYNNTRQDTNNTRVPTKYPLNQDAC